MVSSTRRARFRPILALWRPALDPVKNSTATTRAERALGSSGPAHPLAELHVWLGRQARSRLLIRRVEPTSILKIGIARGFLGSQSTNTSRHEVRQVTDLDATSGRQGAALFIEQCSQMIVREAIIFEAR